MTENNIRLHICRLEKHDRFAWTDGKVEMKKVLAEIPFKQVKYKAWWPSMLIRANGHEVWQHLTQI